MDFGSQTEEVHSSQEEEVQNREEETVDNGQNELVREQGGEGKRRKSSRLQEAKERTQEDTSSGRDFFEEIKEWREKENEKLAQKRYEQELKETASQKREKQRKIAAEKRASTSQEEEEEDEGGSAKKKAGKKVKYARQLSEENERVLNMFKHGNKVNYLLL